MLDLLTHRPYELGDHDFICATWVNGLVHGQPKRADYWFENHIEQIEKHTFKVNYNRVVNSILAKPTVHTLVACLIEDPSVILGYAVLEDKTLHWVHVKEAWRKFGIARHLVPPQSITTVTHLTAPGLALKRRFGLTYDPFKI